MRLIRTACLLLLGVLGLLAQADDSRNLGALLNPEVVREINLRDDQRREIRRIYQEYRVRLVEQRAAAERAEADLRELFNQDQPDQKRGAEVAERLATARAEMLRLNTVMRLRWRGVLTKDQWAELQRKYPNGVRRPAQIERTP